MKKAGIFTLLMLIISLSSCQLIGDIFKAGVWVGVLLVVGVVALILFILGKVGGGGK